MQTSNRILDDLAKVANGAVATVAGMKGEVEAMVRQQLERLLSDANLVPRDEFDAMADVARNARAEQEKLEIRVAALEAAISAKAATGKAKSSKATSGASARKSTANTKKA